MQNEPVSNNAALAAILLLAGPWLTKYGIDQGGAREILGIAFGIGSGVVALWRVLVARRKVTPLTRPRSATGHRLVVQRPERDAA